MKIWAEHVSDIKFPCPLCGQHIAVPSVATGDTVPCPGCNADVKVPTHAESRLAMVEQNLKEAQREMGEPENPNWQTLREQHLGTNAAKTEPARVPEPGRAPTPAEWVHVQARAESVQIMAMGAMLIGVLVIGIGLISAINERSGWTAVIVGGALCGFGFALTFLAQIMHVRAVALKIADRQ